MDKVTRIYIFEKLRDVQEDETFPDGYENVTQGSMY